MNREESNFFLECKDHTVTGEQFKLYLDKERDMLITLPKPEIQDLEKYYQSEDYISHTDAKRSFFEKAYHIVKTYAIARKVKLISSLSEKPGRILDIGAGTGDFLIHAKNKDWIVEGVEPNEQARKLSNQKGVELKKDSSEYGPQTFDVITMWHVLEHVPDLKAQIEEIKRLLKPEGHLIIAVPNYKSYDAVYYKSFWAAYDVPRHLWHFSKKSMKAIFEKENLDLKKIKPMKFDSFYVSLLSEKYKTGKMKYLKAIGIGLLSNLKGSFSKEYSSHIYIFKNNMK